MFESQVNKLTETAEGIPQNSLLRFNELSDSVTHRTVLNWGEHCTECVWPTCYSTCTLYSPRLDGRCRQFVDGMVRIPQPNSIVGYLLKITFKPWGKLWTVGNLHLFNRNEARKIENKDLIIGGGIQMFPLEKLRKKYSNRRYWKKKRWATGLQVTKIQPNYFLLECYNPNTEVVDLTVEFLGHEQLVPFLSKVSLSPGFHRTKIAYQDIFSVIRASMSFTITITLNGTSENTTIYFGAMDFVVDLSAVSQKVQEPEQKCKCLVWDLDNTLWGWDIDRRWTGESQTPSGCRGSNKRTGQPRHTAVGCQQE